MDQFVNTNVKNIKISGIRQFFNYVQDYPNSISLTIGQPDFPTPKHVKEAAIKAINEDYTSYTNNAGYIELRRAAANFLNVKYGIQYNPNTEIIVTVGATEGIDIVFRTLLTNQDEVLLPGPIYPGYEPLILLNNAKPVYMDTRNTNFKVTADLIKKHLTEKTRLIVLPYPSNPTGVSLTGEELQEIANVIKGKNIFVLADEIYSELVYGQRHVSIAKFLPKQTIIINGLSKSHSMTGWRIGFVFAPEEICQHMLKVHQYNVTCASSISQMAAIEALTNGIDDALEMRAEYLKRRDFVYEKLCKLGFETVLPDGAFYFFVKIPDVFQLDSFQFCLKLVKDYGVAVVPGSSFSNFGEGYFRLSYATSFNRLEEGLNRLGKIMQEV